MDKFTAHVTPQQHQGSLQDSLEDPLGLSLPEPEYLESEQNSRLFEVTMYKTGLAYVYTGLTGAMVGIVQGALYGERATGRLMFNSILNQMGSKSIGWANQAGIVMILYQTIDIFWNRVQETDNSPVSGVGSGTIAGTLYSVRGGPKRMLIGATLGSLLGLAYSVYTRRIDLSGTLSSTYRNTLDYFEQTPENESVDEL